MMLGGKDASKKRRRKRGRDGLIFVNREIIWQSNQRSSMSRIRLEQLEQQVAE